MEGLPARVALLFILPVKRALIFRLVAELARRRRIARKRKKTRETGLCGPRLCAAHIQDIAAINKGLKMQKWAGFLMVALAALALLCQSAEAGTRRNHDNSRLVAAGIVGGVAGTATSLALRDWRLRHPPNAKISEGGALIAGTFVCAALSPIVATILVKRELTLREAHVMAADCLIPFIGGWLVNKAFDAHPEWEGRKVHSRRRRH
jgi:hypothetical protein